VAEPPPLTERELRFWRALSAHGPKDQLVIPVLEDVIALRAARQGTDPAE
jgi:hypothetical protein